MKHWKAKLDMGRGLYVYCRHWHEGRGTAEACCVMLMDILQAPGVVVKVDVTFAECEEQS